jgi:hypothetical protein
MGELKVNASLSLNSTCFLPLPVEKLRTDNIGSMSVEGIMCDRCSAKLVEGVETVQ